MAKNEDSSENMAPEIKVALPGEQIEKAVADAVSEISKSAGKGLGNFAADILGGSIGDRVHEWRKRRQLTGLKKTAMYLRELDISLTKMPDLPEWEIYKIFEGMSSEETDSIHDLWAGLLAGAIAGKNTTDTSNRIFSTLKQMTTQDAIIFNEIMGFGESDDGHNALSENFHNHDSSHKNESNNEPKSTSTLFAEQLVEKKFKVIKGGEQKDFLYLQGGIENLLRLGLIYRTRDISHIPADINSKEEREKYKRLFLITHNTNHLLDGFSEISSGTDIASQSAFSLRYHLRPYGSLNVEVGLTEFGERFSEACYPLGYRA